MDKNPAPYMDPKTYAASTNTKGDHERTVDALIYISKNNKTDGFIRQEYVARMEKASIDGQKLGLSRLFLEQIAEIIHRSPPQERERTNEGCSQVPNPQGDSIASPIPQGGSIRKEHVIPTSTGQHCTTLPEPVEQ